MSAPHWQPAILEPVPSLARFLVFDTSFHIDPRPSLARLRDSVPPERTVFGIGQPIALALGAKIPGLRAFPAVSGIGCTFPSTQGGLWVMLCGSDAGDLHDRARSIVTNLGDGFVLREEVASFKYRGGRNLSGYEDGTENPKDERAVAAAIVSAMGSGLDGGSFVAAQRWVHDLGRFARRTQEERDSTIGRREKSNEEIADAPASAHVKRTAQESFDPPAFMVRRLMPYGTVAEHGLYFVAYGESLNRFERMLQRMAGLHDGIVDGLLSFSQASSGGYYFCPPVRNGRLDLSAFAL